MMFTAILWHKLVTEGPLFLLVSLYPYKILKDVVGTYFSYYNYIISYFLLFIY